MGLRLDFASPENACLRRNQGTWESFNGTEDGFVNEKSGGGDPSWLRYASPDQTSNFF